MGTAMDWFCYAHVYLVRKGAASGCVGQSELLSLVLNLPSELLAELPVLHSFYIYIYIYIYRYRGSQDFTVTITGRGSM